MVPFRVAVVHFVGPLAVFFLLVSTSSPIRLAAAFDNGAARRPIMGWSTWCGEGGCGADRCSAREILGVAHALRQTGLFDLGYSMIMLDDCWAGPNRSVTNDTLMWDPIRFPIGMPALIHELHALGFNVSLYTSIGDTTCDNGGRPYSVPGSYGHFQLDVDTFAEWGADGIIADCCGNCRSDPLFFPGLQYINFSAAVMNAQPPRVLYLQGDAALQYLLWDVYKYYNAWQAFSDHHDHWRSTAETIAMVQLANVPGRPGAWPYMDVLMTGGQGCKQQTFPPSAHCPGQTDVEYVTEYTMWSLVQSPLIIGTDVRNMTAIMKHVLYNNRLIAWHRNTSFPPGKYWGGDEDCAAMFGALSCQLWGRWLSEPPQTKTAMTAGGGDRDTRQRHAERGLWPAIQLLVVFYNAGSHAHAMQANLTGVFGWPQAVGFTARDVWSGHRFVVNATAWPVLTTPAAVASHGVVAIEIESIRG